MMSPSAAEKSSVPTSMNGVSVNRCVAGRSSPTVASTEAGKLFAPYTRTVWSVNCTMEAWKCAASFSRPTFLAASTNPVHNLSVSAVRLVALPTKRTCSARSCPETITVGAMALRSR
ncbi:Uncharacterised protein [Mycobacteroides abscessus subsp. abscessus]|nr:Uncharacterised protein [Mycobacteroides abscessus subsp. abscessus]